MEGTGRRRQAIPWKQIRHLEKLPSLSHSISYSVVAIPHFPMELNSVAGSYSKKTSSKGCSGEVQIWQLTSRLRNISEFHRSVIQQFLVYKGHCDARPRGRTKQTVFLEDGGGGRKGKNDVIRRVRRRELGTSLDFDRKKYLGRGQLRDPVWPWLNGNDVTNSTTQSCADTRESNWQRVKSLWDVQFFLSLLHYHCIP